MKPMLSAPNTIRPARNYRRTLVEHVFVLLGVCALPLVGLVIYFLSTGLHREIGVAERARAGLSHVQQTVAILQQAVRLAWSNDANDGATIQSLDLAIAALDEVEASLAKTVKPAPLPLPANDARAPSAASVRAAWQVVKNAPAATAERRAVLRDLVEELHGLVFHASDQSGLSGGPENEISALTDVVAFSVPLHIERLLHMHARMAADLRTGGWDAATIEAASIFSHQIEEEDFKRVNRSITAALLADARSHHVSHSLQGKFPGQAEAMLAGLRQLAGSIRPVAENAAPAMDPRAFDSLLYAAFESAMAGWQASIVQLDSLVGEQIANAETYRNRALLVAGMIAVLLLPAAWLYFRLFIRPVIEAMVSNAAESLRAAEAARAEADESTRRLRQTQAALDDHCAVAVVDVDHRFLAINERMNRLTGFTRDELLQQPFALIAVDRAPKELWIVATRGEVWHGNLCHRAKDGRPVWVHATVFPFLDRAGRPVEFVFIETDITELVHAREVAESAAKAKSQFLAMMSHEIRTPMNGVIGFAHLLADTKLDEQQRDYARTILTSGESLLIIINDILDFSKLEAGKAELELRPVALRLLVEDVLDLLSAHARTKNLELVYEIESDVPEGIVGDAPRLRQILLNLAGNAVKFTASGHVEIAVASAPNGTDGMRRLVFHVRDTGIGIPPDRLDRLFKAFSQVDASVNRTFGGTGLGLAISQRLVGLMGGEIAVNSMPGQGSDFYFTLPVAEADVVAELHERASVAAGEVAAALRGRRVLVVDDLPANQRLLQRILAQYGAEAILARSAETALEALNQHRCDLAVLDYMMPGIDGIALAGRIRQRANARELPLILVASTQPDRAEKGLELFDAVCLKPIRNQPFAAAAARALSKGKPLTAPLAAAITPGALFAQTHPLRILVVDDNPVNLKVIAATLRSLGYAPATYNDAGAAMTRLREEQFDLVLMDVQMPELDGHEATRRLRAGAAGELNQRTRVIALTAGAMVDERDACLAAGMDDFMAKPVPRAELLEKLATTAGTLGRPRGMVG